MTTGVDVSRRRAWWLLPELAAVALLAALAWHSADAPRAMRPAELRAEVALRVQNTLEHESPAAHHDHGHTVGAGDRVLCAVEVFGTDPPDAARAGAVRTAYGYYLCAAGRPGTPYLSSQLSGGPLVATMTGPPKIVIPLPGGGFREQVHAIMPRYEQQAIHGFTSATTAAALRARFERQVTTAG